MKYRLRSHFSHHPLRLIILTILGLILSLNIHPLPQVKAEQSIPTQISPTPHSPLPTPHPITLVQAGKNHYDAGQFSEAIQVLQQAAQTYESTGDSLKQAQVLSLLSLSYQKLGQWEQAEQAINTSLSLLKTVPEENNRIHAQVLNAQGRLLLGKGNAEAAFETWKKAETLYQQVDDPVGILGSQINQAEAMQALGLYRRTEQLLEQVKQELLELNDSPLKVTGLQTLGNVLRQKGDLDESHQILTQSLALAQQLKLPQEESELLLSLGNTNRTLAKRSEVFNDKDAAKTYIQEALNHYQKAVITATSPLTRIQAQLNQLSLLIEISQFSTAEALLPQIASELTPLPVSRQSVYAHVNLAESLMKMSLVSTNLSSVSGQSSFATNYFKNNQQPTTNNQE
ncbi:MAG TPA: hypothetical protein DEG47_28720, partial [Cyanobacteria bacterium UBA11148]|nr:hypothetical protein [Cyanobacteria bacterium UBA11148]